jgi:hypothetical protein
MQAIVDCRASKHQGTLSAHQRTNGFVERMNRTPLDECFRIAGRQTWYIGAEEIQRDLDTFMTYYNFERSHQGYRLRGRTPAQALREALGVTEIPSLDFTSPQPIEKEVIPEPEIAT